ncbi:MAG: 2-nitropropane dioxygenase, partial [Candidatus Berkelbacteria bacterium]|nr:2-nitropropane dioxygenase [Candidatus Berkelbacteria bacterium]
GRPVIVVQGGMGAGVSLPPLSGEVARLGAVGVVSSIGLDRLIPGQQGNYFEAARIAIEDTIRRSDDRGLVGVNCMAMMHTYRDSVAGAIAGGVKAALVGAGLPLDLPRMVGDAKDVALIPIVSSVRALQVICARWRRLGRMPDAVVVEGPLAGGHLGFKAEDIEKPEFQLEEIFPPILQFSKENGNFPIIVAGGIWSRADILRWIAAGASGVQMGTRFLATHESGASPDFKNAVVESTSDDIFVATNPGSPSGMPFRIIKSSPGYQEALRRDRPLECKFGYMLHNGHCRAREESRDSFCICNALLAAIWKNPDSNEMPIFTVGASAARVKKIVYVRELMDELKGVTP